MDRLQNCPNCGGILDDFGKCQFCGSKVYDLCDIDIRGVGSRGRGRSYIRIRTDNQIVLAQVLTNEVNIKCSPYELPTMSVEYVLCENALTIQEVQDEQK